ncbi:hypothetical protein C0993_005223 [Termitomyces sp. T159_Od127]|nr:hypothetical protein C0993_005223 [Termitomyces sp. T159_Od127]
MSSTRVLVTIGTQTASLLQNPGADRTNNNATNPTFSERVEAIAREPLTPLTKILMVLTLVLLLFTSVGGRLDSILPVRSLKKIPKVFIGLFAGVQHKLNLERERNRDGEPTVTVTTTVIATSTAISTQTTSFTTTSTTTSHAPSPTAPPKEETCLTPQCILLSGSILSSLDTSQDPCENFYDFATGGWLRTHPLPADKSSYGNFEAVAERNRQIIQRILESKPDNSSFERTPDQQIKLKLRDFYTSCLNEDTLDEIGTIPLLDFVEEIRKKFRGESKYSGNKESSNLTAALAFLHSQGVEALFSFEIEGDVGRDPNDMTLWFGQPSLGLPSKVCAWKSDSLVADAVLQEYYKDKVVLNAYREVVKRILLALFKEEEHEASGTVRVQETSVWPPWPWPPWDEDDDDNGGDKKPMNRSERAHKLSQKIVTLEKRLAKASLDLDILLQNPIATYNPLPLSNLTDTLPQIDFPAYFAAFTPRNFPSVVIQTHPAYASSLTKILHKTSEDVVEAYLIVRAALALAPYLGSSTEAWQAQRSLYELLNGIKKGVVGDRSEYCTEKVEESLGFAVGRYFVNETFAGDSKERGTKIITEIVKAFKASLPHIDWMDKKSSKAAAEKADAIRVKVGYPVSPDTEDASSIARYYNLVKVDKMNFFNNIISASKSEQYKKWQQLGKRRDPDAWLMFPSTVNAYFDPPANEIVFPAGILQPPFFDASWPSYIAYGAFGHVASHELTHAFDSAGRLYNQDGKLEEWWTNSTSEGFRVKQKCIVDQFSAYTIDDGKGGKIHVNGNLTSGENIGDTGLVQAYRAWKAQYDPHELLLPGLEYTREQLFFISFARIWARAMKTAAAVQRIRTDPHSPSRYRVDGTVYNIPEFAQAFNCSKKAKLNPPREAQCRFW